MRLPPAVVIHGLNDARVALAERAPVTLLSAPGAALFAGCAAWGALALAARAEAPDVPAPDILDCADAAGQALAALRIGQHILVLAADSPGREAVAAIAAACGASLLADRPAALDLGRPGAARRLRAWLHPAPDDNAALPR